tara:strand:- start:172 stop:393 length:222 start_codon:yes stop_codon:yes gene_type:complete
MLKLIEKGFQRDLAYKIVQDCAMKSWNENSKFNENLIMNKQLNDKLSKKDINKIIDERNDLKKIDWIYKNKIK